MHVKTFKYNYSDLTIDFGTLSSAMGYSSDEASAQIADDIREVLSKGSEICEIEGGYVVLDAINFDKENYALQINDVSFDVKKIVFNQLKKSMRAALFVCTAGHRISTYSKQYMSEGDLLRGYVYDIFGSIVVEAATDLVQTELKNEMLAAGYKITNRYSPGYCNWNVSEQQKLFGILPPKFCGIELTDTCLMKPIKSVSGIIGIGKDVKFNQYTCNLCDQQNCIYRNLQNKKIGMV
ncbi:MAG: vitamin B12 dependent-methionine synthase activation domain-containing protein [bacterium]